MKKVFKYVPNKISWIEKILLKLKPMKWTYDSGCMLGYKNIFGKMYILVIKNRAMSVWEIENYKIAKQIWS